MSEYLFFYIGLAILLTHEMDATKEGSKWPDYVKNAVESLNNGKIFLLSFDYINKPGHLRAADNKVMSEYLIEFIENNLDW